jgi:hypothetical protein
MFHRLAGFLLIDLGVAAVVVSAIVELGDSAALTLRILAGVLILSGIGELAGAWYLYPRSRSDQGLEDLGRPATATVLDVQDRGVTATGEQVARLRLRVTPTNERPFTARSEVVLEDLRAEGERVRVKFDPHRRRRLIVIGRAG